MIYEINPSWIEKTLIEVSRNSGYGKTSLLSALSFDDKSMNMGSVSG